MNILLVDDDDDIHKSIGRFLHDFGHEVVSAKDGAEALKHLRERKDIDWVLSDICMPGMDGIELMQNLQVRFPGLPTVLMTGEGGENVAMTALKHGAYDYLKKPVTLKEILAYIERIEARKDLEKKIAQACQPFHPAHRGERPADAIRQIRRLLTNHLQGIEDAHRTMHTLLGTDEAELPAKQESLKHVLDEIPSLLTSMRNAVEELDTMAD